MSFFSFFRVFLTFSYKKHEFSHLYRSGSLRWYHSPAKWWFLKFSDFPLFSLEFFGLWRPPKSRFSLPTFKKSLSEDGWFVIVMMVRIDFTNLSVTHFWNFWVSTPKNLVSGSRGAAEDRFNVPIAEVLCDFEGFYVACARYLGETSVVVVRRLRSQD